MKSRTAAAAVICLFAFLAAPLAAQEWTAEQTEVWESVEAYTKLAMEGDVEGFVEVFHPDFVGWHKGSPVPDNYETRIKMMRFFLPMAKVMYYDITPLAIRVHGDVAIVHYLYSDLSAMDEGGEPEWKQGRWTDVLLRQDGKWMLIADHGGPDGDAEDDDD